MGAHIFTMEAAATFGLETLVRTELESLGLNVVRTEDRRVTFEGTGLDIARCNVCLRTADRVWLRLGEFPARDFDELYEGVRAIGWREALPRPCIVEVDARSSRSQLAAVPSIQSVSKKAIVDSLLGGRGPALEESGPRHSVEVVLQNNTASVLLDTSGPGLHKRGYRRVTGHAPLRENLAAALVMLSRWEPSRPFADPLCGSGTIAIEAALIGRQAAPGLLRKFAGETLPAAPASAWHEAREQARASERKPDAMIVEASDRDGAIVEAARRNARAAGVEDSIRFSRRSLEELRPAGEYGCIVCNPPYGERLGTSGEALSLYRAMGQLHRQLPTWSFFALTSSTEFPKAFGERASKNRKLYNGNIRCYLYQYFGPLPRRDDRA